jgi:hypothetical protein
MTSTWGVDSEFGYVSGLEVPSHFVHVVFCAINADTQERRAFFGRDARLARFIYDHDTDLFLAHNLVAEAKYLLQVGITPPRRWWDTYVGYRYSSNAEHVRRSGLLSAATKLGVPVPYFEGEKKLLQGWIGTLQFDPASPDDRARIRDYCFADAQCSIDLYRRLAGQVPEAWMATAVEFCLAIGRMEMMGLPLDLDYSNRLQERKGEVLAHIQADTNRIYPVFRNGVLDEGRLLSWCTREGIGWPLRRSWRTGRDYRPFDDEVFKKMAGRHPFLEAVRQANKTVKQLNDRDLAVDPATGRHYLRNVVFAQKTSRTSLRASLFSAPKWMRFLLKPSSPEHRLLAFDFSAEEFLLAAHLSGDEAMVRAYRAGDPHWGFAIAAGLAPPEADPKVPPLRQGPPGLQGHQPRRDLRTNCVRNI